MYNAVNKLSLVIYSANLILILKVGERIRVILDCDDNTLAFERNYEFLGVAFRGKVVFLFIYCHLFIIVLYFENGEPLIELNSKLLGIAFGW